MLGTSLTDVHPSSSLDRFVGITEHILAIKQYAAQKIKG